MAGLELELPDKRIYDCDISSSRDHRINLLSAMRREMWPELVINRSSETLIQCAADYQIYALHSALFELDRTRETDPAARKKVYQDALRRLGYYKFIHQARIQNGREDFIREAGLDSLPNNLRLVSAFYEGRVVKQIVLGQPEGNIRRSVATMNLWYLGDEQCIETSERGASFEQIIYKNPISQEDHILPYDREWLLPAVVRARRGVFMNVFERKVGEIRKGAVQYMERVTSFPQDIRDIYLVNKDRTARVGYMHVKKGENGASVTLEKEEASGVSVYKGEIRKYDATVGSIWYDLHRESNWEYTTTRSEGSEESANLNYKSKGINLRAKGVGNRIDQVTYRTKVYKGVAVTQNDNNVSVQLANGRFLKFVMLRRLIEDVTVG